MEIGHNPKIRRFILATSAHGRVIFNTLSPTLYPTFFIFKDTGCIIKEIRGRKVRLFYLRFNNFLRGTKGKPGRFQSFWYPFFEQKKSRLLCLCPALLRFLW